MCVQTAECISQVEGFVQSSVHWSKNIQEYSNLVVNIVIVEYHIWPTDHSSEISVWQTSGNDNLK